MRARLDELFENLQTTTLNERNNLRKHFLTYSRECGRCEGCEFKYKVLELYELHLKHIPNKRHNYNYEQVELFLRHRYNSDGD
jgi:hypothetical protein